MKPKIEKVFPTLRYQDPRAALQWLCEVLGFSEHFVAEHEGKVVHAQLRRGDDLVFIGPDYPDDKYGLHSPLALGGGNQCVCVAILEDVDAHCARAKAGGAEIVTAPYDTPFGAREYTCRDPEGHVWCFSTYPGGPLDA